MKAFLAALLVVLLVGGIFMYSGCGPQIGVVQDKVLAKINSMIGTLDVEQKKVEQDLAKAKDLMAGVTMKRIEVNQRIKLYEQRKTETENTLKTLETRLQKLKEHLAAVETSEKITVNGEEYTKEVLNKMAKDFIGKYEDTKKTTLPAIVSTCDNLKRSFEMLSSQETKAKEVLGRLERKITEIGEKRKAIQVYKENASIMSNDSSIMTQLEKLEKSTEDLSINVETAFQVEEEKTKDYVSTTSQKADQLFAEPEDLNSTMSKIDELLGKGNENK